MVKKVLLVGSSFSAVPILLKLKSRGYHVSVCGSIASDPCHQLADASYSIDYSDAEAVIGLVNSQHFDFIVPSCNDFSYLSCAEVAQKFGYPGFDPYPVAVSLHTKSRFRHEARTCGLKAPSSFQVEQGEPVTLGGLALPVLVKPTDSFSGRGVTKVVDKTALAGAVGEAFAHSRNGLVVIEEFVEGRLYSHSAFIQDRKIVFDVFADEFCTIYPYQVDCSCHPSSLTLSVQDAVRSEMSKLIDHLHLTDGLLHTQFIADDSGVWIIECMRRCPGDLYYWMIELSTAVDYLDLYVRPYVGECMPTDIRSPPAKFIGRHTISVAKPIVAGMFTHRIPAQQVRIVPLKTSGELLGPAPFDKLAILFAEFAGQAEMQAITPNMANLVSINTPQDLQL